MFSLERPTPFSHQYAIPSGHTLLHELQKPQWSRLVLVDAVTGLLQALLRQKSNSWSVDVSRHPNGFLKLVWDLPEGYKLRVHFWPAAEAQFSDIHDHATAFRSMILAGSYSERRYDRPVLRSDGSDDGSCVVLKYPSSPHTRYEAVTELGTAEPPLRSEHHYLRGSELQRAAPELHAVRVHEPTVTVSLWSSTRADYTMVMRSRSELSAVCPRTMDRRQLKRDLRSIIALINR